MTEHVWKWQPKFVSPILLLKMKNLEKDISSDEELSKQKPTIPETYRTPPENLGPDFIHHKNLISNLSNHLDNMKNERNEDVRNMNKKVQDLPVKIRQMTCNAADDKINMKNGSSPRVHEKFAVDEKYLSTDIVKQVETWMKNQSFSEQYAPITQRSQNTPPPISDRGRKRRKKRSMYKDGDFMLESSDTAINYTDSEIISTADSKPPTNRKLFEPRERKLPTVNVFKTPNATKISNGFSREPLNRNFEKPTKNSRFGSIHDEIEFQKRYKRISDLQNHLQFVNGSYLSGKNILTEPKKAAPVSNVKKYRNLDSSDMFTVSPIEKQGTNRKTKQQKQLLDATPVFKNFRKKPLSWQKFQKLPNITPDGKVAKKALSESNVKFAEESQREAEKSGSVTSALQTEEVKEERARSVVTDSSYGPYQEMKVTIHIRYKKPTETDSPEVNSEDEYNSEKSSVRSLGEETPFSYDGRIHAIGRDSRSNSQIKQRSFLKDDKTHMDSPVVQGVSQKSNISKKDKEILPNFGTGTHTLPSLLINDPVSKTPRITTGKLIH